MFKWNPDSSGVRACLKATDALYRFTGGMVNRKGMAQRTNLCHLVHLLGLGILVLALHIAILAIALWGLFLLPGQSFGWGNFVIVGEFLAGILTGCVIVYLAASFIRPRLERWARDREYRQLYKWWNRTGTRILREEKRANESPGIVRILWHRLLSLKQGLCPGVEWTRPLATEHRPPAGVLPVAKFVKYAFLLLALVASLNLVTGVTAAVRHNFAHTGDAKCTLRGGEAGNDLLHGEYVRALLKCAGKPAWSKERRTIAFFLDHPAGTLTCETYKDGEAVCFPD